MAKTKVTGRLTAALRRLEAGGSVPLGSDAAAVATASEHFGLIVIGEPDAWARALG